MTALHAEKIVTYHIIQQQKEFSKFPSCPLAVVVQMLIVSFPFNYVCNVRLFKLCCVAKIFHLYDQSLFNVLEWRLPSSNLGHYRQIQRAGQVVTFSQQSFVFFCRVNSIISCPQCLQWQVANLGPGPSRKQVGHTTCLELSDNPRLIKVLIIPGQPLAIVLFCQRLTMAGDEAYNNLAKQPDVSLLHQMTEASIRQMICSINNQLVGLIRVFFSHQGPPALNQCL